MTRLLASGDSNFILPLLLLLPLLPLLLLLLLMLQLLLLLLLLLVCTCACACECECVYTCIYAVQGQLQNHLGFKQPGMSLPIPPPSQKADAKKMQGFTWPPIENKQS